MNPDPAIMASAADLRHDDVAASLSLLGLFHRHRMRRFATASCRGRGMQSGCARARILLDELFQATWPKSLQVYHRGCD